MFADYRVGQRERMPFGPHNQLQFMGFDLNVPYDVYLDTIDNSEPDGECAHHLFLRRDLFGAAEAEKLADSYGRLVREFAARPEVEVREVELGG